MDSSKMLIIGASGQLGGALRDQFTQAKAVGRSELDITNWKLVEAFEWSGIETIVNAAAYTDVDGAETLSGRRDAWQINAQAPAFLAKIANRHGITLVHFSSDYVFDGTQWPHTEEEPVTPLGVYAQTKAAGDIAAATAFKHYIIRTSWLIGDGHNFVRSMIGLAKKGSAPKVVNDQLGRLTFTSTLARGVNHLLASSSLHGLYNITNGGEVVSWADVAAAVYHELGHDEKKVTGITTSEYYKDKPDAAPRPLRSELDLSKIEAAGFDCPDWQPALKTYLKKEASQ